MRILSAVLALVLAAAPARASGIRATELLVHAASSLTDALGELATLHEARSGVRVRLNLGGSNMLARQIVEGAPGDVFFSADEGRMDQVAQLIDPATRRSLLSNSLVVVAASDSPLTIGCASDLAGKAVASVALADPGSVPAGIYAKDHLRRIGAWDAVQPKVVPTENVRGALAAVEAGNVDAAIVYATDARMSKQVRVTCTVPAGEVADISCPIAVLRGSEHPEQARAFVDFLASPEAAAVFERFGFVARR